MGAAFKNRDGRPVLATGPLLENPMPQGLTLHTPQILFHGHYGVLPESPVGQWNTPPFEPQLAKGKDGRTQIFPLPVCA
jgi:acetylornithine deacetylase/succinyl-diaminopimelate desuccinylase-like protein